MKGIRLLLLSLILFVVSKEMHARPFIFNLDTIYADADFCDRVEIINYDSISGLLSVKSHLDLLTYSFVVGELSISINDFRNNKNEYLLIRGNPWLERGNNIVIAIGILKRGKWVFNKMQFGSMGAWYIRTYNPVAQTDKENWFTGEVLYPEKYFKYKTPSATWPIEQIESNRMLYDSLLQKSVKFISFDSLSNHYFNDTLYVKKTIINPKHIRLMFNVTYTGVYQMEEPYSYLASILNSLQLPYEKILECSQHATQEQDYREVIVSYSNASYKLVVYRWGEQSLNEGLSFLDLYLK